MQTINTTQNAYKLDAATSPITLYNLKYCKRLQLVRGFPIYASIDLSQQMTVIL